MATRAYPHTLPAIDRGQMDELLRAALSLPDCTSTAVGDTVFVTDAALTAAHDPAVHAVIAGYVLDADFGVPAEHRGLRGAVVLLRQWADDAEAAVGTWDTLSTAQRFATMKVVLGRLELFMRRFADLLIVLGRGA